MKICMIGCGKMGEAMLSGWLHATSGVAAGISAQDVSIVGHTQQRNDHLAERYGVHVQTDMRGACGADMVVLAVKPQVLPEILPGLAEELVASDSTSPLILSIAAGVTTSAIEGALGPDVRVVRAMPNTPLQVGQGATAIASGSSSTDEDLRSVCDLFDCLGMAVVVQEDQIDIVGALSGAAPAYLAAMLEALCDAAASEGLSYETACALLVQSGFGTFDMMRETGQTPEEVRISVCSPGGTTLAALGAMEAGGFSESLENGVHAAILRAKELA